MIDYADIKSQVLAVVAITQDPEIQTGTAIAMMGMFKALIRVGFSEDRAMQILIATAGKGIK